MLYFITHKAEAVEFMTKLPIKLLQVVLVFCAALTVYLLTAAFVPYPGISTDYLASLCFPGAGSGLGTYMLDEWIAYCAVHAGSPDGVIFRTTLLSAACGALLISLLFLAVKSGVRLSCLDLTGIRNHELARAERDIVFIMRVAGTGAVLAGLAALPIWAMSTRLLPGAVTTCVGMAFLSLAIGLRRLCAEDVLDGALPTLGRKAMMGAVFGLAVFIGTLSPMMLPVAIVGILFGGWVLILPRIEGRLSYFPWIFGGSALGIAASIGVSAAWHAVFDPQTALSPALVWARDLAGAASLLTGMVLHFEGAAPLVLFAAATALFFGTFPRAFLRFGTPVIGQIGILALVVLSIVQWPEDFWALLSEPSPLTVLGMVFVTMLFALLVGSWAKSWLDVHLRWQISRAYGTVICAAVLLYGSAALLQVWVNAADGAGISARQALTPIREMMSQLLPDGCTVWIDPPQNASLFLVHRYADGNPVCPIRNIDQQFARLQLKGKPSAACCAEDPVLAELAAVGGAPLMQYLRFSDWGKEVLCGSPAATHAAQVEAVASRVAVTSFGRTVVGKRFVRALSRRAAVAYAAQAFNCPDAEAEPLLRRAKTLDPENLGVLLSLGALAESGRPADRTDTLAAIDTVEKNPWLRAPTVAQAEAFELRYGPVRSETFRAAKRLRKFLENPEDNVAAVVEAYRTAPERLSGREQLIALLNLTEPEILAGFEGRDPSRAEIEAYLCFHLRTERAQEYYKRCELLLKDNDALSVLYRNRGRLSSDRLHEKAYAFFSRDGYFPYAYVYLVGLLQTDDLTEAIRFVSGFSFREALAEQPCLAEDLRIRVLNFTGKTNLPQAMTLARDWLHKEPLQPRIWSFLLAHSAEQGSEACRADVRACLRHYPLHPAASDAFAADLRTRHGEEAARRWLRSAADARAEIDLLKE